MRRVSCIKSASTSSKAGGSLTARVSDRHMRGAPRKNKHIQTEFGQIQCKYASLNTQVSLAPTHVRP